MAAINRELLVKLTKYIVDHGVACDINVIIGEGADAFTYNFRIMGSCKKLSPSQRKRNEIRRQKFCQKKTS